MSFAAFSVMSFLFLDTSIAARTAPIAPIAVEVVMLVQETQTEIEPTEIEPSPVSTAEPINDEPSTTETLDEPLAFEGETDEQVVERLMTALEDLETLKGDFTQIAPSGAVSDGQFYLRRPGFLRFEYEPPTPLLIVANGGMVYVRDEALETTDSYPVGRTPLKYLLRKKVDFGDATVVGVDRGIDTVAVTFASDGDETEGELTIIVKTPEMTLARWIVRDLQSGITVVNLENVETGIRLANSLFRAPEAGGQFLKN